LSRLRATRIPYNRATLVETRSLAIVIDGWNHHLWLAEDGLGRAWTKMLRVFVDDRCCGCVGQAMTMLYEAPMAIWLGTRKMAILALQHWRILQHNDDDDVDTCFSRLEGRRHSRSNKARVAGLQRTFRHILLYFLLSNSIIMNVKFAMK
jgi:hypothetical protein